MNLTRIISIFFQDIYIDILLLLGIIILEAPLHPVTFQVIAGLTLTLISVVLWVTARIQLGSAFSVSPQPTALVTHGLYAKFTHPMYLFSTLALFGILIAWPSVLLAGLFLLLVIIQTFRIRKENQRLKDQFGSVYINYRSGTWI